MEQSLINKVSINTLHPVVKLIASDYVQLTNKILPGKIKGFYIYGSIVLNDFFEDKSDLDFISIVDKKPEGEDIDRLQLVHSMIQVKYKKPNMNGIYVTEEQLGKTKDETLPITFYYEGKIHDSGYFDMNLVTWYQLKHNAITLSGIPSDKLSFEVDTDKMIKEMRENMNTYWKEWVNKTSGISLDTLILLLFPKRVEWGVLGVSRQYYSFRERGIVSKSEAGEWALNKVPEKHKKIIQEALNIRQGKKLIYSSPFKRKKDTLVYMKYIIKESCIL